MSAVMLFVNVVLVFVGFVTTVKAIEASSFGQAIARACQKHGITFDGCMWVIVILIVIASFFMGAQFDEAATLR